jgi:hypothetical protein
MEIAAVLLAIAAIGGIALAALRLRGSRLPASLAVIHGIISAAGLVALLVEVLGGAASALATIALALLVLAALGGFVTASFHVRRKPIPVPFMLTHAALAVAGFGSLLGALFG